MAKTKIEARIRRKIRIRQKVKGTPERPRLTVSRSNRHICAQVVDDESNHVIATVSSTGKAIQAELGQKNKSEQAKQIGTRVAILCKEKGIEKIVFDRNGYQYHGRILALAKAAREAGLKF